MLKKLEGYLVLQLFFLVLAIFVASFCLLREWYFLTAFAVFFLIYIISYIYINQIKVYQELKQFAEAIKYRDFSKRLDSNHPSPSIQILRESFKEINNLFKDASHEKEKQYQYLQKILEMVDTGILSYETESGAVVWMNETIKNILQLPYLKTVHSLAQRDRNLYQQILSLKPGASKIGEIRMGEKSSKVLLSASTFFTDGKRYNLIAFKNINEALDKTESNAWQKLLSVLTHEIMNSIAPISSLADTLKTSLISVEKGKYSDAFLEDLELGINTIKDRSQGLLKFAETYRNLSKVIKPDLKNFYVRNLFENLYNLMHPTFKARNIELGIILKEPNIMLNADLNLVEQVLINLLVNALEAVKNIPDPRVDMKAGSNNEKIWLHVADNGTGIHEDVLDKIFVPFFSTKKNGSGIGLTLSKQIMMLHNGSLQVQSKMGEGTVVFLQF